MEFVALKLILLCLCAYMLILPTFAASFITNEKDNFEVIEEELPACAERELYKIEYFSGIEKLNTTLLCKCNADRERTEMTWNDLDHPTVNNTWIRNFLCIEVLKKLDSVCFEHQICRREYIYNFGSYRVREQYVDTTEEYCDCQGGLECKKTGYLPKSISCIVSHDKVISYRCMPYIHEYEQLKPCVKNQTYLNEILRYISPSRSYTIKLNTYMKCICVTNAWKITQKPDVDDPVDENQLVRTYICPWRDRPSLESSCKEFAICGRGYKREVGLEEPDKWLTQYFTIFCRCDYGRQCLEVGEIGRYETIHRCFDYKARNLRKNCKDEQVYRVEIHQKYIHTKNGTPEFVTIKLNTIQMCICSGNIIRMGNDTGSYNDNEYITKYRCQENSTLKEIKPPYCFKNEVCRINDLEIMGRERGNVAYRKTSQNTCICSYPRACIEAERPNISTGIDRCILSNDTQNDIEPCNYYQLYKVVIRTNLSDSKGVPKRMNTIILCKCNYTLYDVHTGSTTISRDPRDRTRRIQSYFCTQPKNTTKELQSCEDNEICRMDVYENYGEDVDPHVKYLLNSLTYCKCDKKRYCYNTEKQDPRKANKIINTFRCVKEACGEHELCRIFEYSWSKELQRNETLCHCTGECSYRPLNAIGYSWDLKNRTEYYTCKFPSSASATTRGNLKP